MLRSTQAMRYVINKRWMLKRRGVFPLDAWTFFASNMALWLSWFMNTASTLHHRAFKINAHEA